MKKYILFLLLIAAMTACDSYLEENPKSQVTEEKANQDADNLYLNTVAVLYNYIGGNEQSQGLQGTYRGVYDLNTFTTDEAVIPTRGADWYDGGFWQDLFLHRWGISDTAINDTWNYLYKVIVLSNNSLETLQKKAQLLTADELSRYSAEVRALRAMFYYYLLDMFGRVPLVVSTATPLTDVRQGNRSEIFQFVVKELQQVAPLLPAERSNYKGKYYGRFTRPIAFFLLAKLALNAEVYSDDDWTDGQSQAGSEISFTVGGHTLNAWQTVQAYCDSITAMGYALEESLAGNFAINNESSVENIYTIPMDKTLYTNQMQNLFRSYHYGHAAAYGLGGENGSSATLETLRTFAYDTDTVDNRFAASFYAGTVYDLNGNPVTLQTGEVLEYKPWDIRLVLSGEQSEQTAGARMRKYAVDASGLKDGKLMDNDIVLFRYADVLLMKSEARVRNGENGDAELNAVRSRSGMNSRTATLPTILDERLLELVWEGWRRQDLVRFGLYTRAYEDRPQLPGEDAGYTTVFPIPGDALSLNHNLTQNPGYGTAK